MSNPFEDSDYNYVALTNIEGQFSLWPEFIEPPKGWEVSFGPAQRSECLAHIELSWTDMRPNSLIRLDP
ncbi:MbtH family NRPS accessory protein (plasmid) [Roseibium aggregatum]|uniref:MbtH family protein n=1 Tax=Roseibium aggregatum TaxID=187304 RepID=UPI001E58B299|nr:MbtH family protein [Roseibium aggregatum]UES60174.1 MbtH family NRPS accessory protein [Roseibium aggregatum]UES60284.1 MbtH family NRPS accessory protein [Roseibium aggregatum]